MMCTTSGEVLLQAIQNNADLHTIKQLLENGASVNERHHLVYPLDVAVDTNNEELVKLILKYATYDITETCHGRSKTVLHRACEADNPNPEIVRAILEYGIDINYVDHYGETALHMACKSKNKEIVQLLIDHGIDINFIEEGGDCCCSAIYYAIHKDSTDIFELLVQHGAQIFTITSSNCSLYEAALYAPDTARFLLKHEVNLSSDTEIEWSDLSNALFNNDFKLARELLGKAYEIDMLCLYAAAVCKNTDIFQLVWTRIASESISKDMYFMIHVFDTWGYDEKLDKLWILLKRDGVDLHLDRCGAAFTCFINRRFDAFKDVSEEEQVELLQHLVDRGLRLSHTDVEQLIKFAYGPEPARFFEHILHIFLPKVSRKAFILACGCDLDRIVLPYCLEADFESLFDADGFEYSLDNLQYYLGRFSYSDRESVHFIVRYSCSADELSQINRWFDSLHVKSLVELARDALRAQLARICKDSRHLHAIFDYLKLPTRIKDIIQCKVPVNTIKE